MRLKKQAMILLGILISTVVLPGFLFPARASNVDDYKVRVYLEEDEILSYNFTYSASQEMVRFEFFTSPSTDLGYIVISEAHYFNFIDIRDLSQALVYENKSQMSGEVYGAGGIINVGGENVSLVESQVYHVILWQNSFSGTVITCSSIEVTWSDSPLIPGYSPFLVIAGVFVAVVLIRLSVKRRQPKKIASSI